MTSHSLRSARSLLVTSASLVVWLSLPGVAGAIVQTGSSDDPLAAKTKVDVTLQPTLELAPIQQVAGELRPETAAAWKSFSIEKSDRGSWNAIVDRRSGLVEIAEGAGVPWIPGVGNTLTKAHIAGHLGGRSEVDLATLESLARAAVRSYAPMLGTDGRNLVLDPAASGPISDYFWQVEFDVFTEEGYLVEGARVFFRVNNGNLVQWGAARMPPPGTRVPEARLSRDEALQAVDDYVGLERGRDVFLHRGELKVLPAQAGPAQKQFLTGAGYALRPVWEFLFRREQYGATWRVRVDAVDGEVVDFRDVNQYAQVTGGYWPVSWRVDGTPVAQVSSGWPFTTVSPTGGTTNTSGVYLWDGSGQTALHSGPYVVINDNCTGSPGTASSDGSGNIGFGTYDPGAAPGTPGDCTAALGIADNTASARQQYWHLNKIKEKARSYLPTNLWLQNQLTANVNIDSNCNAFWNGSTVNFYTSGGGCNNTGEDAGVSMHEWGHGMDSNDGSAATAENGTGETYGDTTAFLQTLDSCVGQGFLSGNCGGYGNSCNLCDGVRDVDWGEHSSNAPMTVSFIQNSCPCSSPAVGPACSGSYNGPCGINFASGSDNKEGHCESLVSSGALWDFAAYDLQSGCGGRNGSFPDYDCPSGSGGPYDQAGAFAVLDRLWYLSRSSADQAFTCDTSNAIWTSHGCNSGSNWKTLRAVDDDDGNLSNGTPHSCQLAAAFDRHGIACTSDASWDVCFRGCTPPSATTLATPTAGNQQVDLSWSDVGGGNVYDIYRNEVSCASGFTRIADDFTGTSYFDTDVGNGTTYYYQVVAHADGNESCAAAPSNCESASPSAGPSAKFVEGSQVLLSVPTDNDTDGFLDNCESGQVRIGLVNDGNQNLTNVSFTVTSSDPAVGAITTGMPVNVGSLSQNSQTTGTFEFDLDGATCAGSVEFDVSVTATEMTGSNANSFEIGSLEIDLQTSSPTDDFESDEDGWALTQFSRDSSSSDSGAWSLHSTSGLTGTCDIAESPSFQVTGTSQVVFAVSHDIEDQSGGNWWDKANVHAVNEDSGVHTLLTPTGRTYNAGASASSLCHVTTDAGWAGTNLTWGDATFDLSGLTPGDSYHLEVNYNTDEAATGTGFWFDNVRWTDVSLLLCDAQGDSCIPCVPPETPTGLTASAPTAGQVDLSWSPIAVAPTNYRVYRSTSMGGPYSLVASVSGATTSYSDTTVTPGVTYYYVVRAFEGCNSGDSNEASATPFGDCGDTPTFGGVGSVTEIVAGGSCGMRVAWSAGTNNCSGEPLAYNVYRSATASFTPGPGNLVASCVTGTSWDDTTLSAGDTVYYTVRAEDAETGNGGACRDGNEDGGTSEASGSLSPGSGTLLSENFDGLAAGTLPAGWLVGTFNSGVSSWQGAMACSPNSSSPNILRYGGTSCTFNYGSNEQALITTGALAVPVGTTSVTATFDHRWVFRAGDEGTLYVSNTFPTFTPVGSAFLSGQGYTTGTGFSGTMNSSMLTTTVDLGAFCTAQGWGTNCVGESLYFAWAGFTDGNQTDDGWYIDDVSIAYTAPSCTAAPNAVDFLTATSTSGQNVLEWLNPSSGLYGSTMIRWSTSDFPADPSAGTLLVDQNDGSGNHGTFTHSGLTNGTTYYYSAFADNGSGEYSARKTVAARPFDTSGSVAWGYHSGASALTPPAIASIYGVANDRVLHSMDGTASGVWPAGWSPLAMNGSAQARPPVVPLPLAGASKVAFVGSQDGRVYAADADTGAQLWFSSILGTGLQAAPTGYFSGFGGTTDLLMIGTRNPGADNELIALDPADGSQLWSFDNGGGAGGIGIISGDATVDYPNQRVYFASRSRIGGSSDTVWALDFTGGGATLLWSEAVGDLDGSPVLASGRIYVGTLAGEVVALDAATGAVEWTFDATDGPVKSYVWPRFGSSEILFSTTNRVWSISDDGASASQNWSHAGVSNPSAPLVFTLGATPYAWVGSDDGSLHQLDISGASPVATSVQLGDGSATVGAPALDVLTGTTYVGAENGVVYSVSLPLP